MANADSRYEDQIEHYLRAIAGDERLSKANKEDLLKYRTEGFGKKSLATVAKNLQVMHSLAVMLDKDFRKVTKKDIQEIVNKINNNRKLSGWTQVKYLVVLKRFFRCFYGVKRGKYPDLVDNVEIERPKKESLDPDSLWMPEDIRTLLQNANNARDRFLISLLYDCGCRSISELEKLNCSDIVDKGHYLQVNFRFSKTNARTIPIINTLPYFREYKKELEQKKAYKPDNPLFPTWQSGAMKRLSYDGMLRNIQRASKKAHLSKRMNLHFFRKSTASLYARYFKNEILMNKFFGWGSGIKDIYVGIRTEEMLEQYKAFFDSGQNILRPLRCPKCNIELPGYLDNCSKCGEKLVRAIVITEEIKEKEAIFGLLEVIEQNPEMRKSLISLFLEAAKKSNKKGELLALGR